MINSLSHSTKARTNNGAALTGGLSPADSAVTPRRGAATILELDRIKVTSPFDRYIEKKNKFINGDIFLKGIAKKCKSWLCEKCRVHKGLLIREKLLEKTFFFKEPRLYTITINREWFASPEDAYNYVMKKKFIARLLTKEMKIRRWVWVLEAQEQSGDGWPHWHILIDVADLPGRWYNSEKKEARESKPKNLNGWCYVPHFFDLNKVHRLLRKWKIGEQCKLTVRRDNFQNPIHAIRYITKYLIKSPKRGFPPWMLNHSRLRFIQASRAVGSLSGEQPKTVKKEDNEKEKTPRMVRPPVERIAECGKQIIFSYYDAELDKNVFTEPVWALKKSIELSPGAVSVDEFDFITQKSYKSWGFRTQKDVWTFQDIWNKPKLKDKLQEKIKEKCQTLLTQWDNALPRAG